MARGSAHRSGFIPGRELSAMLFEQVVRPTLTRSFPNLIYSAGLIGPGSEVMGFDSPMSMDHDWGPRVQVLLNDSDLKTQGDSVSQTISASLPERFLGYRTAYFKTSDYKIRHRIGVGTARQFILEHLSLDIDAPMQPADWLTTPEQELRSLVSGVMFHDALGVGQIQQRFAYYPHDIWLYLLASGWERIGQEEHLVGRAGFVGDELGATIIAARLVRDIMRLSFLIERVYAPYPKWFGTGFKQLACADRFLPILLQIQRAKGWKKRDTALVVAYEYLAEMQNALGLIPKRICKAMPFHDRPFSTIEHHCGFASALRSAIMDPEVRVFSERRNIGSIDQFSDSTDLASCRRSRTILRGLYQ